MSVLSTETLRWLAGTDNPAINYLVHRDFPGMVSGVQCNPADHAYAKKILAEARGSTAGSLVHYDQWYRGCVWIFAELVSLGLDVSNQAVKAAADFIINTVQLPSGGFSMNWAPPAEAAGWTGDILYYLLKSGLRGKEVDKAAQWLMSAQRVDGGWCSSPINGLKDTLFFAFFGQSGKKRSYSGESSLLATVSCGRALALYSALTGQGKGQVGKSAEFVLNYKRLLRKKQSGGELYLYNPSFLKIGYPVLCQQDLLSSLLFIAEAGMIEDERAAQPFNILMRARFDDGTFPCTSRTHGSLHAKYRLKRGVPDKWTTLQAMRLMKLLVKKDEYL